MISRDEMIAVKLKKRVEKSLLCAIIVVMLLALLFSESGLYVCAACGSKAVSEEELLDIANGIISWKKADCGSSDDGYLINDKFLEAAGTTAGDWYPIGLSRLGIEDNFDSYLAVITDIVKGRYEEPGRLSSVKATEWHRISLSILAAGGDPTNMGSDQSGRLIDLIADGTYNRGESTSLGRQGINGWIWGLITLDSMRYEVPEGAYYTRDDIIIEILKRQLDDGGFALSGSVADPDITAMALQALSPYYNDEKLYTYNLPSGKTVTKAAYQVIDEALCCLSELQLDNGGFKSWGTENVESADQVIVALCCLNIDPFTDSRFIKNGNTIYDNILTYRMADGGFVHSYTYDPDNPSSLPDASNSMAGEQTLYTIAALVRSIKGMRSLYDFRPEQSAALKERITSLESKIEKALSDPEKDEIEALLSEFYSIPEGERCYVSNYRLLSNVAKELGIDIEKIVLETEVKESPKDNDDASVLLYFSQSDKDKADAIPSEPSTEWYVTVVSLLDKLDKCEDFEEKAQYIEKLSLAKEAISLVQAEIDALNFEIKEKLYPFDGISLADKRTVDDIVSRHDALSDYDKAKIERYEDVLKAKTKIDTELRGIAIASVLVVITAVLTILLVHRIRKRKRKKEAELDELCALYADED